MKLILKPRPPFNFDLHWKFFSWGKPSPEVYEGGIWRRALRLRSGELVPLEVSSVGTPDEPRLEVLVLSKISGEQKRELRGKLSWIFNTKSDLSELYALMEKDPVLKAVKEKLYGLRPFRYPTVFEGVVKSILQQQISLLVSRHMTARLIQKFGEKVQLGKGIFYEFPAPASLARATSGQLRGCGLSRQKAAYVKNFSKKVAGGEFDPEGLKELSSEEMIERLVTFEGIGRWTAELVVVTSTEKEALPADDLGARRAVSNFYFGGKLISGEELRRFADRWGKFGGTVVYYLICAERLK